MESEARFVAGGLFIRVFNGYLFFGARPGTVIEAQIAHGCHHRSRTLDPSH
jgi:hypothetical protein